MKKASVLAILLAGIAFSLAWAQAKAAIPDPVKNIFKRSCAMAGCHQGQYPAMNMNLDPDKIISSTVTTASLEKPSLKIIDAESPEKSYLLMKIRGSQDIVGKRMPLKGSYLKDEDIQTVQDWINDLKAAGVQAASSSASGENGQNKILRKPAFWGTRLINLPTARTIDTR